MNYASFGVEVVSTDFKVGDIVRYRDGEYTQRPTFVVGIVEGFFGTWGG